MTVAADTSQGITRTIGTAVLIDDDSYCAYPGVVRAANGDIVVAYYRGTAAAGVGVGSKVRLSRSDDDGATWSTPEVIVDISGESAGSLGLCALTDGTLVLTFFTIDDGDDSYRVYSQRSTDDGETWETEVEITHGFGYAAALANPATQIPSGALLMPLYGSDNVTDWGDNVTYVRLSRSTDGGQTWADAGTAIEQPDQTGFDIFAFNESYLLVLEDRLLLLARTEITPEGEGGGTRCYGTYGSLTGTGWTEAVPMFYPSVSAPHSVVADDGIWICVRSDTGSKGHYLASPDEGARWTQRTLLPDSSPGDNQFEYADWDATDGLILVASQRVDGSNSDIYFYPFGVSSEVDLNPGTYEGTFTLGQEPLVAGDLTAASVEFADGDVVIDTSPSIESLGFGDGLTLEAAIKPGAEISGSDNFLIVGLRGNSGNPLVLAELGITGGASPVVHWGVNRRGPNPTYDDAYVTSSVVLNPAQVYMIRGTLDADGNLALYIDEDLVASDEGVPLDVAGVYPDLSVCIAQMVDGSDVPIFEPYTATNIAEVRAIRGAQAP